MLQVPVGRTMATPASHFSKSHSLMSFRVCGQRNVFIFHCLIRLIRLFFIVVVHAYVLFVSLFVYFNNLHGNISLCRNYVYLMQFTYTPGFPEKYVYIYMILYQYSCTELNLLTVAAKFHKNFDVYSATHITNDIWDLQKN